MAFGGAVFDLLYVGCCYGLIRTEDGMEVQVGGSVMSMHPDFMTTGRTRALGALVMKLGLLYV